MCSRKLILALLVLALTAACGRKEPPKPPPSKVPAPITDLQVHQRGQDLILMMSYPSITLGGLAIEELESIEIWRMSRIVGSFVEEIDPETQEDSAELTEAEPIETESEEPEVEEPEVEEPEEEPESSFFSLPTTIETAAGEDEEDKESLIQVSGRDFVAVAKPVWMVEGTDLDSAVIGDQIILRIPLEKILTSEGEEEILVLAMRTLAAKKRASPFSNLEKIYPRVPPAAPAGLTVEATPDGVQLDWEVSEEALGYRVYRRNSRVKDYAEPLYLGREGLTSYVDRTAIYGDRYIYTVTSVGNLDPVVESTIIAEHEVDYKDRFPPTAPTEVVALAETADDTQGYWIYRQDPGAGFEPINEEPIVGSEYLDRELDSGMTYRYYLLAVDENGNLSEASEEIEVRVP